MSSNCRRRGIRILPAILCLFALPALADCTLPKALEAESRAHPSEDNAVVAGSWFADHRQFDCALKSFQSALRIYPKSAQLFYLEGVALSTLGRPAEAIQPLQKSIHLAPRVVQSHLLLADLYRQTGQSEKADDEWKLALEIDPHSELALEQWSDALLAREDFAGVVELLRNAPRTEKLALNLSHALGKLNYLDAAGNVLNEALKLAPRSVPLADAESVVLVKQHRFLDAITLMENAVREHPDDREAELQLFRVMVLTNHIEHAQPLGLKLLARYPHDAEILYLNGVLDNSSGDYAKAKAHLEEAVSLDPNFFSSRFDLGKALVQLKEWKEAKEQLQQAIALGATAPPVYFELAKALNALGETEQAKEQMKKYQQSKKAEDDGAQAASHAAEGEKDMDAGNFPEAISQFRAACEIEPNDAAFKYKLALALHKAGNTEEEQAQLEAAVKLDPQLAAAQKQLGYLLSRSGDAAGAVEHFKMAVRAEPEWTEAWINLAAELAIESHFSEARDAVSVALRLDPENAQAKELSARLEKDAASRQDHP